MPGKFSKVLMVGMLALPISLASTAAFAAESNTANQEQRTVSYQRVSDVHVAPRAYSFTNCTEFNKTYAYGAKLKGATDKVKTDFSATTAYVKTVSSAVYTANKKLDYDKDKVVCERTKYKNCAKMNTTYKHGMGLKGAKDKATKPVTNFSVVSWPVYNVNSHLDRDGDKISCEKK